MPHVDERFLEERLDAIAHGLREGVRREIARREKLGLPIYVADNGQVVDLRARHPELEGALHGGPVRLRLMAL